MPASRLDAAVDGVEAADPGAAVGGAVFLGDDEQRLLLARHGRAVFVGRLKQRRPLAAANNAGLVETLAENRLGGFVDEAGRRWDRR